MTKVYRYTDDSYCPCCNELLFECYNAVGWNQNGSALDMFDLYSQILLDDIVDGEVQSLPDFNPYESFTLEEVKEACNRSGLVLVEVL